MSTHALGEGVLTTGTVAIDPHDVDTVTFTDTINLVRVRAIGLAQTAIGNVGGVLHVTLDGTDPHPSNSRSYLVVSNGELVLTVTNPVTVKLATGFWRPMAAEVAGEALPASVNAWRNTDTGFAESFATQDGSPIAEHLPAVPTYRVDGSTDGGATWPQ